MNENLPTEIGEAINTRTINIENILREDATLAEMINALCTDFMNRTPAIRKDYIDPYYFCEIEHEYGGGMTSRFKLSIVSNKLVIQETLWKDGKPLNQQIMLIPFSHRKVSEHSRIQLRDSEILKGAVGRLPEFWKSYIEQAQSR